MPGLAVQCHHTLAIEGYTSQVAVDPDHEHTFFQKSLQRSLPTKRSTLTLSITNHAFKAAHVLPIGSSTSSKAIILILLASIPSIRRCAFGTRQLLEIVLSTRRQRWREIDCAASSRSKCGWEVERTVGRLQRNRSRDTRCSKERHWQCSQRVWHGHCATLVTEPDDLQLWTRVP